MSEVERQSRNVLHFDYRPPTGDWILRLMTRLHKSPNLQLRARVDDWAQLGLGELAGAIMTRSFCVKLSQRRIDRQLKELSKDLKERIGDVRECVTCGCGFSSTDCEILYELLLDFDSLLFEARSAFELTCRFVEEFRTSVLEHPAQGNPYEPVAKELEKRGHDIRWIQWLRTNRNAFIHDTAPWIALDVASLQPFKAEVVLLKRDVSTLANPDDFLHIDDCRSIIEGFRKSFGGLEQWLAEEIDGYGGPVQS